MEYLKETKPASKSNTFRFRTEIRQLRLELTLPYPSIPDFAKLRFPSSKIITACSLNIKCFNRDMGDDSRACHTSVGPRASSGEGCHGSQSWSQSLLAICGKLLLGRVLPRRCPTIRGHRMSSHQEAQNPSSGIQWVIENGMKIA